MNTLSFFLWAFLVCILGGLLAGMYVAAKASNEIERYMENYHLQTGAYTHPLTHIDTTAGVPLRYTCRYLQDKGTNPILMPKECE